MKLVLSLLVTVMSLSLIANGDGGNEEKLRNTIQVVDERTGEPIIGADIHIEGIAEVLYTDPDGYVELDYTVNSGSTIRISYISYEDCISRVEELSTQAVISLTGRQ